MVQPIYKTIIQLVSDLMTAHIMEDQVDRAKYHTLPKGSLVVGPKISGTVEDTMGYYEDYGRPAQKALEAIYRQKRQRSQVEIIKDLINEIFDTAPKKSRIGDSTYFDLREEGGTEYFEAQLNDEYGRLIDALEDNSIQENKSIDNALRDLIGLCCLELTYRNRLITRGDRPYDNERER